MYVPYVRVLMSMAFAAEQEVEFPFSGADTRRDTGKGENAQVLLRDQARGIGRGETRNADRRAGKGKERIREPN